MQSSGDERKWKYAKRQNETEAEDSKHKRKKRKKCLKGTKTNKRVH